MAEPTTGRQLDPREEPCALNALARNCAGGAGQPASLPRSRFRDIKTLQQFAAAHASIHNHFNQECHLYNRENFKLKRSAALAEWRQLAA